MTEEIKPDSGRRTEIFTPTFETKKEVPVGSATIRAGQQQPVDPKSTIALQNAETNKRIAIEREAKRKANATNREQSVNEPTPNHKPRTINHKPVTNNQSKKDLMFTIIYNYYV